MLKTASLQWPGVKVYYREEWKCEYFDLNGKFFALRGTNKSGEPILTIKNKPETNEILKEQFSFIVPGYYANKTHWISILLDKSTFSEEELVRLLKESYDLIFANLPKKTQKEIAEKNEDEK